MTLAVLYAGQGSQFTGMGRDFYDEYPETRAIFDHRPDGLDIKSLCFGSTAEILAQTEHTQPCMGAFAAALTLLFKNAGIAPDYAAGLSLGEYGALHMSGVFDAETLVNVLAFRGRAMADAARGVDCAMVAVLGLSDAETERAVEKTDGDVWCCNYNCPGQIVIGGESGAVKRAAECCTELGARRCLPLNVSGPFHTPYMAPAGDALRERFRTLDFAPMQVPVVFNVTGKTLADGENIPELLVRQVQSPVLFERSLRTLSSLGVDSTLEIGGKALSAFVKKTAPEIRTLSIEKTADFRAAIEQLRGI